MKKVVLSIDGMTCSACSNGLEKYLNKQNGIKSATVNLVMANALIEYDENILNNPKVTEPHFLYDRSALPDSAMLPT